MCEADERPSLVVGGGSPAEPDAGARGRAPDGGQPPAAGEAAGDEPDLDPVSPADDLVGAVVDFVDLLVERDITPDDDTG